MMNRSLQLHPLEQSVLSLLAQQPANSICVAYSGGMDSSILLHCCAALKQQLSVPLTAWHINHRLLPQADQWQAHCINQCRLLDIPLKISQLAIRKQENESTEMAARRSRYAVWEKELPAKALLLQAHHQRDQAETLLWRLLRGSRSLYGMPQQRTLGKGTLLRPLLDCSYATMKSYQQQKELAYIKDTSNMDTNIERNFIRHSLLPLIKQRWPSAEKSLCQTAERLAVQQAIIKQSTMFTGEQHRLAIADIMAMSPREAELWINAWLVHLGLSIVPNSLLAELLKQLQARADATPKIEWDGVEMHRYQGYLYAMPLLPAIDRQDRMIIKPPAITKGESRIYPLGLGSIMMRILRKSPIKQLVIRYRQGGEKIKLHHQTVRHSLKNILQESHIPPWLRPYVPLIYYQDELVAVAGIKHKQDFLIKHGLTLDWQLAPQYGIPNQ